jgi:D-alanine-D-alanine ligase
MRVAFTYNLKREVESSDGDDEPPLAADFYAECDTPETVAAIRSAIASRHEVYPVEANEDAVEKFRNLRPDMVFNIAEGIYGRSRESHIPAILEMLRIPYTGSDPLTLAICLDKARCKEVLCYHGIPTAQHFVVPPSAARLPGVVQSRDRKGAVAVSSSQATARLRSRLGFSTVQCSLRRLLGKAKNFPYIVKPLYEGSSKGIRDASLVRNARELARELRRTHKFYGQPAIVEEYLPGREFTVALIGNGPTVQVLPIVEIKFDQLPSHANPIYSFEAKWVWDTPEKPLEIFECPARIPRRLQADIADVCKRAFVSLGCQDWCRVDVRLDKRGKPNILEVNPLPGILPNPEDNSCFPKAARVAGMSYDQMILRVLSEACERYDIGDPTSECDPNRERPAGADQRAMSPLTAPLQARLRNGGCEAKRCFDLRGKEEPTEKNSGAKRRFTLQSRESD